MWLCRAVGRNSDKIHLRRVCSFFYLLLLFLLKNQKYSQITIDLTQNFNQSITVLYKSSDTILPKRLMKITFRLD